MDEKERPFDDPLSAITEALKTEHNHYAAIGRVAAAWSFLEASVDSASIRLAEISPERGVCLTSQIAGIGRKLDAYIALARLRSLPKNIVERLDKFAKRAQGIAEKRNRLIHDIWFFNHPHSPERFEATARKLLRFEYIPTSSDEITRVASEIVGVSDEFDVLAAMVEAEPPSLPSMPPSASP